MGMLHLSQDVVFVEEKRWTSWCSEKEMESEFDMSAKAKRAYYFGLEVNRKRVHKDKEISLWKKDLGEELTFESLIRQVVGGGATKAGGIIQQWPDEDVRSLSGGVYNTSVPHLGELGLMFSL
ncbi:hypothetical protein AgCh_022948 [Apium graveolens]